MKLETLSNISRRAKGTKRACWDTAGQKAGVWERKGRRATTKKTAPRPEWRLEAAEAQARADFRPSGAGAFEKSEEFREREAILFPGGFGRRAGRGERIGHDAEVFGTV